mgnify:FL=1|jgi:ABC-type cobalamin/Fe3+-siderophores transport system ATPase subunit|tara:strand:+ start:122 stop:325 length:204 start_codon:yes stop_codon:yes gene_type:complete
MMTKLETLKDQEMALQIEYVTQEQLYINNYYYDHVVAMIAFEHMNKIKISRGAIQAEIAGLEDLSKL